MQKLIAANAHFETRNTSVRAEVVKATARLRALDNIGKDIASPGYSLVACSLPTSCFNCAVKELQAYQAHIKEMHEASQAECKQLKTEVLILLAPLSIFLLLHRKGRSTLQSTSISNELLATHEHKTHMNISRQAHTYTCNSDGCAHVHILICVHAFSRRVTYYTLICRAGGDDEAGACTRAGQEGNRRRRCVPASAVSGGCKSRVISLAGTLTLT